MCCEFVFLSIMGGNLITSISHITSDLYYLYLQTPDTNCINLVLLL